MRYLAIVLCVLALCTPSLAVSTETEPGKIVLIGKTLLSKLGIECMDLRVLPTDEQGERSYGVVVSYLDRTPHGDADSLIRVLMCGPAIAGELNLNIDRIEAKPIRSGSDWRARIIASVRYAPKRLIEGKQLGQGDGRLVTEWAKTWDCQALDPQWKVLCDSFR
ncbi:hypothetical protein ACFL2Q_09005 [Thermodesulfobacteriota bacterium]